MLASSAPGGARKRLPLRHDPMCAVEYGAVRRFIASLFRLPNNYTKHTPKSQGGKMEKSVVGAVFYALFYAFFLGFSLLPLFSSLFIRLFIRLFLSFYLFRRLF